MTPDELAREVAVKSMEQSREALRGLPPDAKPSLRANVVTTAVRALAAWRDFSPASPEGEEASADPDEQRE